MKGLNCAHMCAIIFVLCQIIVSCLVKKVNSGVLRGQKALCFLSITPLLKSYVECDKGGEKEKPVRSFHGLSIGV